MSIDIDHHYNVAKSPKDIHEHIDTLYHYSKECNHITECGVRSCVSSWAFLKGLRDGAFTVGAPKKKLTSVDLGYHPNIELVSCACEENGIEYEFIEGNDILVPLTETDLLFIDTWHIYGHLRRELSKLHSITRKYIIMHDTTIDEWNGETVRSGWDPGEQSIESGYPVEEITKGLWPAIEEFIAQHGNEWEIHKRFTNCNGLTILKRKK